MTLAKKILCSGGAVVLLIAIVLGWLAYSEFLGGPSRFDADFYQAGNAQAAKLTYAHLSAWHHEAARIPKSSPNVTFYPDLPDAYLIKMNNFTS